MTDFITLPQLPSGRVLFLLGQMRVALEAIDPRLVAQLDAARDATQRLRRLEAERGAAGEAARSKARGAAQAIDYVVDRALSDLAELCAALGKLGDAHPQGAAALGFSKRFFPRGLSAVIHAVYEEQLLLMEELLAGVAEAPAAAWVATLPVEPYLATLRELTPQYRAELEKAAPTTVSHADVLAARRAAQRELEQLVAGVHFLVPEPAQRDATLAPLAFQVERHRALRRGRRNLVVDVDPKTGVEDEAPGEGSGEG